MTAHSGHTVTTGDAARAVAADHQVDNDVKAHLRAAEAHLDAAEQSAETGSIGQAAEHRAAARDDVAAAQAAHRTDCEPDPGAESVGR